ncbi:hypothetical protein [Mariniradius sediminis]|uniref:WG containing repeat-containing protein n=1 Tax=Mariniradius sediminis TaxID=2909237 RepID=A0ABS9BR63_9BACT|nr:hypothetical protein [Mariniradius sediminis]MCF1749854.1 hypothetical protein [Mariniradius sediminis]
MSKISYLIVLIVLFCGIQNGHAQLQMLRDQGTGAPITANPYAGVKGSPYIGDFESGAIIFNEKDTAENIQIAFNGYANSLEVKVDGQLFAYSPQKILGFVISPDGRPELYRSGFVLPGLGENRFVQILEDGNYTLIKHKYKTLGNDPSATYGTQNAKAFNPAEDVFVAKDGVVKAWKTKTKNLEEIFGPDYAKVAALIKENGLNIRDEADVIRLFRLLNS